MSTSPIYTEQTVSIVNMIGQTYPEGRSRFRPSRARLDAIIAEGNDLVANTSIADLGHFSE